MKINFSGITDSTVNLYLKVRKIAFGVDYSWVKALHRMNYGDEMRHKFITGLHQNNKFERDHLQDIVNYPHWINKQLDIVRHVQEKLFEYVQTLKKFKNIVAADELTIINPNHPLLTQANVLYSEIDSLRIQLKNFEKIFTTKGYGLLRQIQNLKPLHYTLMAPYSEHIPFTEIFDTSPVSNHFLLGDFIRSVNTTLSVLERFNLRLGNLKRHYNIKIIAGVAGTGKTHTIGYIVEQIEKNKDLVIFLNAKAFNGDSINFEHCFHQKLFVPQGYSLRESLEKLNKFALKKNRRLFIIFDALNETTTTSLGFSPIWEEQLPSFINLVNQYPHLYFICTLRTSYIDEIWKEHPKNISYLTGLNQETETHEMCIKYFKHYNIEVDNLNTADLSQFSIPLLLDLFCKMTNGDRITKKQISLTGTSYKQIFEGYVEHLVSDVKKKRNLMLIDPISEGLNICSGKFWDVIEGTLSIGEFVRSFDPDTRVKANESLAQPMLEGNLLFIKERTGPLKEIVKHTQQLIGGYLLATYLNNRYPDVEQLAASNEFKEKIDGSDPTLHHQLRLDIIKFLVIYKPMIINSLTDGKTLQEGWWYLYNGQDIVDKTISQQLLDNPLSMEIFDYVTQVSIAHWVDPTHPYNFEFISQYLSRFDAWESDINWTFFLYNNADRFFDFIEENIERLKAGIMEVSKTYIIALLISFVNASTVRELRDQATAYLIEFGKESPLKLLEIAQKCASLNDSYIYQRVVQALYGVALIKQHDANFIKNHLPVLADASFKLQFSVNAINPSYDYIVIDSLKHLIDLAIHKGCWSSSEDDLSNIKMYKVLNLPKWVEPSEAIVKKVRKSREMNPPEPIGMDFAIYTIPRLLGTEKYQLKTAGIANILTRVFELGYKAEDNPPPDNTQFKSFYYGSLIDRNGKVDKLGKKYNWKAFFEYAGHLLQNGQLDAYEIFGDNSSGYKRLSDVDIDISKPNSNYYTSERFFFDQLIPEGIRPESWQMKINVETIEPHLIRSFDGIEYVMMKGVVEQRVDDGYKTRSFIMVESFFIEKNESFDILKNEICPKIWNWDRDLHLSPHYSTGVYFGEYYWADNQVAASAEYYSIKTGRTLTHKRKVNVADLFDAEPDFSSEDLGKVRNFTSEESLGFVGEASLIQYLNESRSTSFKGFSIYIPTPKIGKHLGLKADPLTGSILDRELKPCMISVDHEQGYIKNEATYFRADLLKEYLSAHGYAIAFQSKQHSYDQAGPHNRVMKYAVVEL